MKKFAVITMSVLFLACILLGCNKENDIKVGSVTIISEGEKYTPVENWIYTFDNNIFADGIRKQPQEVADELIAISVRDDFEIVIEGQTAGCYTLFDDKLQEVYFQKDTFEAPSEQGEYILFFEVTWGNETQYQGFQYFCKLRV